MKALLKIYRLCFAGIAGGLMAGLLFATPAMAADVIYPISTWGQVFTQPVQAPALFRYGDYGQPWCPMNTTCPNTGLGQWRYKVLAGTHSCDDATFGGDPYPGRTKRCELVAEYGGKQFAAAQGGPIAYTRPIFVYFGMFDSNGSQTGTFTSTLMIGPGMTCPAEDLDPSTAAGKACFVSDVPPPMPTPTPDFSKKL